MTFRSPASDTLTVFPELIGVEKHDRDFASCELDLQRIRPPSIPIDPRESCWARL
jgi:hypothetical protein